MKPTTIIGKRAIAQKLAEKHELPQARLQQILRDAIEYIRLEIVRGNRVLLSGLGTFALRERKSRRIVHPTSRLILQIPSGQAPVFRPSLELKTCIGQSKSMSIPVETETTIPAESSAAG